MVCYFYQSFLFCLSPKDSLKVQKCESSCVWTTREQQYDEKQTMHVFDALCNSFVDVHSMGKYTVLSNKRKVKGRQVCQISQSVVHWDIWKPFQKRTLNDMNFADPCMLDLLQVVNRPELHISFLLLTTHTYTHTPHSRPEDQIPQVILIADTSHLWWNSDIAAVSKTAFSSAVNRLCLMSITMFHSTSMVEFIYFCKWILIVANKCRCMKMVQPVWERTRTKCSIQRFFSCTEGTLWKKTNKQ